MVVTIISWYSVPIISIITAFYDQSSDDFQVSSTVKVQEDARKSAAASKGGKFFRMQFKSRTFQNAKDALC